MRAWLVLALALAAGPAWAQLQLARIQGVLLDVQGQPMPGAAVQLTDPLGGSLDTQSSDHAGRFVFAGVAPGRYALRAVSAGATPRASKLAPMGAPKGW